MPRRATIAAVVMLLAISGSAARGKGPSPPEIAGVRVGFADRYKVGLWAPVEVRLRGGDEGNPVQVVLTVPDGEGIPTEIASAADKPFTLLPGVEQRVMLYARFGRVKSALSVELRENGEITARRTFPSGDAGDGQAILPAVDERRLMVVIGDGALAEEALRAHGYEPGERPVVAAVDAVASLPTQWFGYEGVDTVAIFTSDLPQLKELLTNTPQAAALVRWVALGGQIIIAAGPNAEKLFAADSLLRPLLPGKLTGVTPLRQTAGLEGYCRSASPVPLVAGSEGLAVAQLADVDGVIDAHESNVPLVVRAAHGFGRITLFTADVDRPPLSQWSDRPQLVARLLDLPPPRSTERTATGGLHAGYRDLTGQLRSALDQFAGVRSVPFWAVAGLAIVYLLLIGPADYFLLRRLGVRPQWTWLSFPLVIAAFVAAAVVIGRQTQGRETAVHQAEIIDVDLVTKHVRSHVWFNLYSPTATTYDISVRPAAEPRATDAATLVAWQGLAGRALGGMTVDTPAAALDAAVGYRFAPALDALSAVPLATGSSKSFASRWHAAAAPPLTAALNEKEQQPIGTLVNQSSATWDDCFLIYDRSAFELGALRPGETAEVSTMSKRSELKTLLTGRRMIFDEKAKDKFRQESRPYDQTSLNAAYVLRAMLFYQAAGGAEYTNLGNDQAPQIDLSALLGSGRALFVARVAKPDDTTASQVLIDGRPIANAQRTVLYRFIVPVEKSR